MTEPIHIISLGAGVQSSTMALMAACGEITPMPVAAIFADTLHESRATYDYLEELEAILPFPVWHVSKGDLAVYLTTPYVNTKGKINVRGLPAFALNSDGSQGLIPKNCSREFKSDQVSKKITFAMRLHSVQCAVQWIGISLDEISRVRDDRRPTVKNRYPLIDLRMTRADCLVWLDKHRFNKPPRSACVFCPLRDNSQWRDLSDEEFKFAALFEQSLQKAHEQMPYKPFLHRSMVPLSEVDFSTEEERGQLNMFNNECEGMCGV